MHDPKPGGDPGYLLPARQRSRMGLQRVGGVLSAEQEHRPDQANGAEEPADGVFGREAGGDDGAQRREAHSHQGVLGPLLENRRAGERYSAQGQEEQSQRREGQGDGAHVPGEPGGPAGAHPGGIVP